MRIVAYLALGAMLAMASGVPAAAADMLDNTFLRDAFVPPAASVNWEGVYLGGDFGETQAHVDFTDGRNSLIDPFIAQRIPDLQDYESLLGPLKGDGSSNVWGGFVGYNWQMSELVLGVEGAYHKMTKPLNASGSEALSGTFNSITGTVSTSGSYTLRDYATVRGRAGYAFGQFMPYVGLGMSVGRMSYLISATGTETAPKNVGPLTISNGEDDAVAYGFNVALGMDVAVLPNVFVRGEWEYIAWAQVNGIRANTNTFRAGIGVRF